jgi:hypothetical protein
MNEESESAQAVWVQSAQPESVANNRRRALQSNLFGSAPDEKEPITTRGPSRERAQNPTVRTPQPAPTTAAQPQLSVFPELQLNLVKMDENFDFGTSQRRPLNERPLRKLNFMPSTELRDLRDQLARDATDFMNRMQRLSTPQPLQMEALELPKRSDAAITPRSGSRKAKGKRRSAKTETSGGPTFQMESQFILPDGSLFH